MYSSTGPSRRSDKSTRKREGRLQAVLIAEPFRTAFGPHTAYPLSPVAPSTDLPFALLPICNTPLIDYVLENLLENRVDEVTILVSSVSMPAVSAHLNHNRTSRGKPWTTFDTIKVTLMECGTHMHKLADAVRELRDRNAVPQSGSFVFVPIDCVAFLPHLRDYFAVHLERVQTIPKYAATLLCTPSHRALRATLHNVLLHASASGAAGDLDTSSLEEPTSPYGSNVFPATAFTVMEPVRLPIKSVPERPREHHTMFVIDESNQVVTYMARLEPAETMPEPPLLSFSRKTRHAVRMDLTPTNFLFCCCEALALIEFHITDVYAFLGTALLGNVGVYGNVFGVLPIRPDGYSSTHPLCTVVDPINSLEAYIQANLDVSARRLFPLTRESCFAEMRATYAVSAVCETVYIHTTAKAMDHASMGPNVVIGAHVRVPASVRLVGTVLGENVQLGERSSLLGCVVLPDAVIGQRCVLRGCLIGAGARIADGVELANGIVGAGCVISSSRNKIGSNFTADPTSTSCNNAIHSRHGEGFRDEKSTSVGKRDGPNDHASSRRLSNRTRDNRHYDPHGSAYSNKSSANSSSSSSSSDLDESSGNDTQSNHCSTTYSEVASHRLEKVHVTHACGRKHRDAKTIHRHTNDTRDRADNRRGRGSNVSHFPASNSSSSNSDAELDTALCHRSGAAAAASEEPRWVNDILPTSGLFTDDAVPHGLRRRQKRNSHLPANRRRGSVAAGRGRRRSVEDAEEEEENDNDREGEYDESALDSEADDSDTNDSESEDEEEEDEEDSDNTRRAEESVDEWEEFNVSIRPYVDKALHNPLQIEASAYDMNTICLSHGFGYPELCETVTELLMEHVLQSTCAVVAEGGEVQVVLDKAREVLTQWCKPFYNALLSKNKSMNIDAMVGTLEGLCAAICDPSCVLYPYGAVLMEIMYNDCDDVMYSERGYCIVSGEGLIAFDEAMRRRGEMIAHHSKNRQPQQEKQRTIASRQHRWAGREGAEGYGDGGSDKEEEDDKDSDDVLEEKKIAMAQLCHDFIMGVKDFLEGE